MNIFELRLSTPPPRVQHCQGVLPSPCEIASPRAGLSPGFGYCQGVNRAASQNCWCPDDDQASNITVLTITTINVVPPPPPPWQAASDDRAMNSLSVPAKLPLCCNLTLGLVRFPFFTRTPLVVFSRGVAAWEEEQTLEIGSLSDPCTSFLHPISGGVWHRVSRR